MANTVKSEVMKPSALAVNPRSLPIRVTGCFTQAFPTLAVIMMSKASQKFLLVKTVRRMDFLGPVPLFCFVSDIDFLLVKVFLRVVFNLARCFIGDGGAACKAVCSSSADADVKRGRMLHEWRESKYEWICSFDMVSLDGRG